MTGAYKKGVASSDLHTGGSGKPTYDKHERPTPHRDVSVRLIPRMSLKNLPDFPVRE